MPTNFFQKKSAQVNLNNNAIYRASEVVQSTGRALPCEVIAVNENSSLVTVSFDTQGIWTLQNITIPKLESNWLKIPTQVGDRGFTIPADAYLDKVSGQSTSTPILGNTPPNLAALVFVPVSNVNNPNLDINAALRAA